MLMFCDKCGKQVSPDSVFCTHCGASLSGPPSFGPPAGTHQPRKKSASGFFSSPVAIALAAILAVAVIGGITIGIILAVRGGSDSAFEEELARVWDEYESALEEDGEGFTRLDMDPNALAKARDDLKKAQEKTAALQDVLKALKPPDDKWKTKYEQLAGTIKYYERYISRLNELYVTLATGTLEAQASRINAILRDLEKLASQVKDLANQFLENNDAVAATDFDPGILSFPETVAAELKNIINGEVATDDNTEPVPPTPDVSDIAEARSVLKEVLPLYMSGGWQAITGYMTPDLYQAYASAPVSWDQVSYVVVGSDIQSENVVGQDTIGFGVLEQKDDFGEQFSGTVVWQMVRSGNTWRVGNYTDEFGESKL
jgi:hypothetical protein